MKLRNSGALGAMALLGLLCTACPNPNIYGTPRTNAPGKISHTVAVEAFGYRGKEGETTSSGTIPTVPTYAMRIGLVDRLDLGVRVANMSSLGADLKLNFLRSDAFDMAIAPGGQWFRVSIGSGGTDSSVSVAYLHAPLVLGFNLSPDVTLVATPGISYAYASTSTSTADERNAAVTSDGVLGRFGLGFQYRFSDSFAIHPEVTMLRNLKEDGYLLYLFGFGFNFGRIPSHAPAASETAQVPETPAANAPSESEPEG